MQPGYFSNRQLHFTDLLGLLPWIPAGPICEIGSGNGQLAAALATYGLNVTALDVDREQLNQARQRYGPDVDWILSDIRNYRMQRESYAAIFCLNVFPYIPNGEKARLIGRLKAAVRPGGLMVISGLSQQDPLASTKLARSVNRVSVLPTGSFAASELPARFQDWEPLYAYEGPGQLNCLKENSQHQMVELIARKPRAAAAKPWHKLPVLGVGLSWSPGNRLAGADFFEIPADDLLELEADPVLAQLARQVPLIPFTTELSLGSPELRNEAYALAVDRLLARCGSPWYSAILAFSRAEAWEYAGQQPVPATEEALETVKQNIRALRRLSPTPLLLEPPTLSRIYSHDDMEPATFLRHVAEEADCGLLLDLNRLASERNISNAIERLPRERVLMLRLQAQNLRHQSLGFKLAESLIQRCPIKALSIVPDQDSDLPELLRAARKLLQRNRV